MSWFKVDDGFYDHPKVDALLADEKVGPLAVALWTLAGSWCSRHLTDGHIPAARVRRLGLPNAHLAAAALVRAGLWLDDPGGDGFRFHGWHERQPKRDDVIARRESARERMRGNRSHAVRANTTRTDDERSREHDANAERTSPEVPEAPDPSPTRPDPTSLREDRARVSDRALRGLGLVLPTGPRALVAMWAHGYAERYRAAHRGKAWLGGSALAKVIDGSPMRVHQGAADALDALATWLADVPEAERQGAVASVLDGAFSDDWMRSAGYPLARIAADPARFAARPTSGRVEPLPNAAYRGTTDAELDAAFGPVTDEELAAVDRGKGAYDV